MNTLLKPASNQLDTWISGTWKEFVAIADAPDSAKHKSYYYKQQMRFENMSTGSDHANDHALILFTLSFYA